MSQTFTTSFTYDGKSVEAEYIYFTKTGRLTIWMDRKLVSEVEWFDWSEAFEDEDRFKHLVIDEIKLALSADLEARREEARIA